MTLRSDIELLVTPLWGDDQKQRARKKFLNTRHIDDCDTNARNWNPG